MYQSLNQTCSKWDLIVNKIIKLKNVWPDYPGYFFVKKK